MFDKKGGFLVSSWKLKVSSHNPLYCQVVKLPGRVIVTKHLSEHIMQ